MDSTQKLNDQQQLVAETLQGFEEIFTIVGHSPEEAKQNAELMLTRINQIALSLLLMKKAPEVRDDLLKQMQTTTFSEIQRIISENFTNEEMAQTLAEATQKVTQAYFDEVKKELSPEQITAIRSRILQFMAPKEKT